MTRKAETRKQEHASSGATSSSGGRENGDGAENAGLRPLGLPGPIDVRADASGLPTTVRLRGGRPMTVDQVDEVWRIAEEWWQETPLARTYYRVIVDGGRPLTLFRDDLAATDGGWYEQQYR